MKQKLKISFYYIQEMCYRITHLIINTIFIFILTYKYKQTLIYLLLPGGITHVISTDVTEIFTTYIHIAVTITFMINIVIFIIQFYLFLRPGLYKFEIQLLNKYLIGYLIAYLYFYLILYPLLIKLSWQFFFNYTLNFNAIQLIFEPRLTNYLVYIKTLGVLTNMLFFTAAITIFILNHTPIKNLIKYRKFVYICMVIGSTLITPPDYISQLVIALLLIKLYEIQLFIRIIHEQYCSKVNSATNQN